jgi:hypothetical protein
MHTAAPTRTPRTTLGAVCLALGALGFAAVTLINPYGASDDQVRVIREHSSTLAVYSLVWFATSLLLVAGAATLVGRVRERGGATALIGGTLAGAGAVASAAVAAFESVAITLGSALPDDKTLTTAVKAFDQSTVLSVVFFTYLAGTALGWPILVAGTARAGILSAWYVLPVVLGLIGQAVLAGDSPRALVVVIAACFVVPLITLASRIYWVRPAAPSVDPTRPAPVHELT